jgi:hypothetical protein
MTATELAAAEAARLNLPLAGRSKFAERSDGELREGVSLRPAPIPPPGVFRVFRLRPSGFGGRVGLKTPTSPQGGGYAPVQLGQF